jgi:hypothetical protein
MWKNHNTRKKGQALRKGKKMFNFVVGEYVVKINNPTKKISRDQLGRALPPRRHL